MAARLPLALRQGAGAACGARCRGPTRAPSDYVRDHVRVDAAAGRRPAATPARSLTFIDQLGSDGAADVLDRLPARHPTRRPGRAARRVAPDLRRAILWECTRLLPTTRSRCRWLSGPPARSSTATSITRPPPRRRCMPTSRRPGAERRAATARLTPCGESQPRVARRPLVPRRRSTRARRRARRAPTPGRPTARPPASDLPFLREQLLDRYDVEYGVLTPMLGAGEQLDHESGAALAHGHQRLADRRVARPEPRLRASINVAYEDGGAGRARRSTAWRGDAPLRPGAAADPHRRAARAPQVLAALRGGLEHDLPVGIHFGGWGRGPITSAGFGSFYIEDTVGMATAFQEQVTASWLRGRLPALPGAEDRADRGRLRVAPAAHVAAGPGVAAAARRDPARWTGCRRRSSASTSGSTTQPIEEPPRRQDFPALLEQHRHERPASCSRPTTRTGTSTRPTGRCRASLDADVRRAIMSENAQALYRFDA